MKRPLISGPEIRKRRLIANLYYNRMRNDAAPAMLSFAALRKQVKREVTKIDDGYRVSYFETFSMEIVHFLRFPNPGGFHRKGRKGHKEKAKPSTQHSATQHSAMKQNRAVAVVSEMKFVDGVC